MTMSPPTHPSDPRGITMVIVLVAMATATILATAYLASRDNSTLIGQNAVSTTSARTGALNGIEIVAALLQTETDWRNEHTNGVLVDRLSVGGESITVSAVDMTTGAPPTDATEYLRITSSAVSGGIRQEATATAFVPLPGAEGTVDIDLGEFSVSAVESIVMRDTSMITRWPAAPQSEMKEPIKILSGTTNAGAINLGHDAAALDAMIYTPPGATNALMTGTGVSEPRMHPLSDTIPMPAPAPAPTDPTKAFLGDVYLNFPISLASFPDGAIGYLKTDPGGVLQVVQPDLTSVKDDFLIGSYSRILVASQWQVIVWGNLEIDPNAAIELLTDTASLDIWVAGNVTINSAHVGEGTLPDLGTRAAPGEASYFDPSRIRIRSMPGHGVTDPTWELRGDSVVKAMLDAPDAMPIKIRDDAALYGNARTRTMELEDNGMVFYDPALDNKLGYTSNPKLWDAGSIVAGAKLVTELSADQMKLLAESNEVDVKTARDESIHSDSLDARQAAEVPPAVAPTAPTPRPVPIVWNVDRTGVAQAESARR